MKGSDKLVAAIDALLPQTQCTRCGYDACLPYAQALAEGSAGIDQCAPGGDATIAALAQLLKREITPLNPQYGPHRPPSVAVIVEANCIGCARCLKACPVDAIVGANKFMHTVIAAQCTGCELCLPACPVDCIAMEPANALPDPDLSRQRYRFHQFRLARNAHERTAALAAREKLVTGNVPGHEQVERSA
jgi:electron transport complex protein RnfB